MICDVIVVGAGPAGMMAAGKAALDGARVILVEKSREPGLKLLLTGNGRCNITNDSQRLQFQKKINSGGDFMETALKCFSPRKFLIFLEGLGVPVDYEKETRVFPRENSAKRVRDAFLQWLENVGVTILTGKNVATITTKESVVTGITISNHGKKETIIAPAVIIATGGLSYTATGSTGDGYRMAEAIGHEVIAPMGSLVPLELGERAAYKVLQGLRIPDTRLYLWEDGKKADDCSGDILFTHFGVSGPVALDISRSVAKCLRDGSKPVLTLDFIPKIDEGDLEKELVVLFSENGKKRVTSLIKEYVPARIAEFLVTAMAGLLEDTTGSTVSTAQRKKIRAALKRLELPLIGPVEIEKATVTAGGVDLNGINPETLESYVCSGLFFAGEVLNVDAYCGGYNLQIAWSTGRLAGESAVRV